MLYAIYLVFENAACGMWSPFRPKKPIVEQNCAWYSGVSSGFACATPCT
jgi:hypothetical protein